MDNTKVQIGNDVLLDIGTHSDWYISAICYDNESINIELCRKINRNNKWWAHTEVPYIDIKTGILHWCGWKYKRIYDNDPQTGVSDG